jgi:site-specific DNA-methyltransferase (adenine-specific)
MKNNIIYNGLSEEVLCNTELFPDNSINLIITSPPYSDKRSLQYGGAKPEEYVDWFLPISCQLKRILVPNGSLVINIKEHTRDGERLTYVMELILEMKKQGWRWVEEYCWYKKLHFLVDGQIDFEIHSKDVYILQRKRGFI